VGRGGNSFSASGTYHVASTHGSTYMLTLAGSATPGGTFTGAVTGKGSKTLTESATLDFGNGDTLSYDTLSQASNGQSAGTYTITGGTGKYVGATGSGTHTSAGGIPDGTWTMSGTVSN